MSVDLGRIWLGARGLQGNQAGLQFIDFLDLLEYVTVKL